tara:strand:+ start:764 stop:1396 length:633 start_codon:yes stop_codon:yes gene_type:complete
MSENSDTTPKKKRVMTQEMLENLKIARVKALEVRARVKLSESEQIIHAKNKIQTEKEPASVRKARIRALAEAELLAEKMEKECKITPATTKEIEEVTEPEPEPEPEPPKLKKSPVVKSVKKKEPKPEPEPEQEPEPEPEEEPEPKIRTKKPKKVKYVYESESSEEEEIIIVKKKKKTKIIEPEPEPLIIKSSGLYPSVVRGRPQSRRSFY